MLRPGGGVLLRCLAPARRITPTGARTGAGTSPRYRHGLFESAFPPGGCHGGYPRERARRDGVSSGLAATGGDGSP
jgi:hypothetical protein